MKVWFCGQGNCFADSKHMNSSPKNDEAKGINEIAEKIIGFKQEQTMQTSTSRVLENF
jgi:hypothetical protein